MSDYKFIIIPMIALIISQVLKTFIELIKTKKFSLERLLNGSGGMPSTHSALVTSLITLIFLNYGVDNIYFAISLVFGIIVLYDAMGIRYEAGKQAKVINMLTGIYLKENVVKLKEKVGHKPIEVLGGIITGMAVALIFNKIL